MIVVCCRTDRQVTIIERLHERPRIDPADSAGVGKTSLPVVPKVPISESFSS